MLVDIHAFQLDGCAVDEQKALLPSSDRVVALPDLDAAEAYVEGNGLRDLSRMQRIKQQLVEVRLFGAPLPHVGQLRAECHAPGLLSLHAERLLAGCHDAARRIQQLVADRGFGGCRRGVSHVDPQPEDSRPIGVVQRRGDAEIPDRRPGLRP